MIVGVPKESLPGERRVALVPAVLPALARLGLAAVIESGAGLEAGFPDEQYASAGARIASRAEVFGSADIVCQVRCLGANPEHGRGDLALMRQGQVVIGMCDPLSAAEPAQALAARGVTVLALELMPRITRAQSMDVLSSQATIAGYEAVLHGAVRLPKLFPMLMTAAGTITPARVFVIGAGVAGLQAIATARRLGAVVVAYDVRPAVKEQVESLGAKFLDLGLSAAGAEDRGGYAKAMDDTFILRQREAMTKAVAESDLVITTAAVPGKTSPVLVTTEMVDHMRPGSIIVDLAAERGGNCELTRRDSEIVHRGVTIFGPTNLASAAPQDASLMYARNVTAYLKHLVGKETGAALHLEPSDEIVEATLLAREGEIVQRRVREIFDLPPLPSPAVTG